MSHIHIPDGVLPVGWWLAGYIIVGILLVFVVRHVEKGDVRQKIPFIGVIGALMLITMSVPLGPMPFHINLTVLTGILAGPWLSFLAILIVNIFLAFLGHGGITVVGINTLILGGEMFVGWVLFRILSKHTRASVAAGVATVCALLISTVLMLGVVGLSEAGWEYAMPHKHGGEHVEDHLINQTEQHQHESGDELVIDPVEVVTAGAQHESHETLRTMLREVSFLNISGLLAILFILGVGIGLETLVTVLMIRFFRKVRPDLLET